MKYIVCVCVRERERMNVWIDLHACMVSNLHNFGRIWQKFKILLIDYKNGKRLNKFQIMIDENVNTMSKLRCKMDNEKV